MRIGIAALIGAALLALVCSAPAQQTLLGTCSGTVGVITQATGLGNVYCTPVAPPPPAPTASITATPAAITSGSPSTLAWSSTNATACNASSGWTGVKPTSGSLAVSPTVTSIYTLTCTGAGGSASASATVTVTQPVTSNCGLILGGAPVFCEPFDVVNAGTPGRTGALDPNVWGVSRTSGYVNFGGQQWNSWAPTVLQSCAGQIGPVLPPNDIVICNGQLREASNDNISGNFDDGNVTILAMYPKQPFDFAGRTGTVSFDVSNDTQGNHAAWPEFWMTNLPVPAPFAHFNSWQALPQFGFGIRFDGFLDTFGNGGACPGGSPSHVGVGSFILINNYIGNDSDNSGNTISAHGYNCVVASTGPGNMNHFEVQVSQNQIDVYGTDAGVTPTAANLKHLATILNVNLGFTRGLVWIDDVHYNADKGSTPSQRQHTFSWDNVAFDGPFTYRDFSYDALDNTAPGSNGSVNLAKFSAANAASSWNVAGLPANPQAASARVLFNFNNETDPVPTAINVTVNGHVHSTPWPYPDSNTYTWRTFAVTIPLTDLVAGTNVVTIGSNQPQITSNVNIVLVDVTNGVPVLPGNPRAYPN